MGPESGILRLSYRVSKKRGKVTRGTKERGKITRRCVRNRLRTGQDSGPYIEAWKGAEKAIQKAALRPPNRVHTVTRESSLEAIQQDPSTCKKRRRYSRRTAVIRKGGVVAAEQGHSSLQN